MGVTDNVGAVFASSMIQLQTSLYEGFPYVILEAATQGTATLAFDCSPGVRELIPPGAGYLVPAQDQAALTRTISHALNNPAELLEFGAASAAHSQHYSVDHVLPMWSKLLHELYGTSI